jgi:hypothetical protein
VKRAAVLALFLAATVVAGGRAQTPPPEAQCAASFPKRLADAKQAIVQHGDFMAGYKAARPALEWFEAHCRFLSELELAVRKLDDPNAFVCDPKAKGRPKGLTSELVLQYSTLPSVGVWQEHHGENHRCLETDRASRVALVISAEEGLAGRAQRMEVICYGDDRPSCKELRTSLEAARAKGKL